jgi:hypothetical protein
MLSRIFVLAENKDYIKELKLHLDRLEERAARRKANFVLSQGGMKHGLRRVKPR